MSVSLVFQKLWDFEAMNFTSNFKEYKLLFPEVWRLILIGNMHVQI